MAKQPCWTPKTGGRCRSSDNVLASASQSWSLVPLITAICFCLHLEGSVPEYGVCMGRTLGILEDPLGAAELSDTSDQRKQIPNGIWWPSQLSGWCLGPGPLGWHCEFSSHFEFQHHWFGLLLQPKKLPVRTQ